MLALVLGHGEDRPCLSRARSASPRSIIALLRLTNPELVTVDDHEIVMLDDPNLDQPPHPREADWVAAAGEHHIFHTEGQGYRDPDFAQRVFTYHLTLVLRHPRRRVHTCAVWMKIPPVDQRLASVERGGVSIEVHTIVLAEIPASLLLSRPETASFAMAAEPDGMTVEELADRVVHALGRAGASQQERAMAGVAAVTRGRYDVLMRAMERAMMEPVLIEDLVDYGYDLGLAEGIERGKVSEAVAALLAVLGARGLGVDPSVEARVRACTDSAQLESWLRRSAVAHAIEDVFD